MLCSYAVHVVLPLLSGVSRDKAFAGGRTEQPLTVVEMVSICFCLQMILHKYSCIYMCLKYFRYYCLCLVVVETQFIDYRFLKDLELRREPKCLCCFEGQELLIYADDKDSVRLELLLVTDLHAHYFHHYFYSTRQAKSAVSGGPDQEVEPVAILHRQAGKAEGIIRNAWADARLVAD